MEPLYMIFFFLKSSNGKSFWVFDRVFSWLFRKKCRRLHFSDPSPPPVGKRLQLGTPSPPLKIADVLCGRPLSSNIVRKPQNVKKSHTLKLFINVKKGGDFSKIFGLRISELYIFLGYMLWKLPRSLTLNYCRIKIILICRSNQSCLSQISTLGLLA